jgi:hypothetical protein
MVLLGKTVRQNLRRPAWALEASWLKKPPSETASSSQGGDELRRFVLNSCFLHSSIFASIFPFALLENNLGASTDRDRR